MKKIASFLFIMLAVLSACNDKKQETKKEDDSHTTTTDIKQEAVSDSAAIQKTVTDFYTWYSGNYRKLLGYELYSSIKKNNAAPYKLDWDQVAKYQAFIRDSIPQLGAAFLENQKIMFAKADSAFKKDVNDDVPVYFDYDWYTNSQESPENLLSEIKGSTSWDVNVRGDNASVKIKGFHDHPGKQERVTFITLGMKKENGSWKIASIGNE